jgi:hypothetical protein
MKRIFLTSALLLLAPVLVFAQQKYTPLVNIPKINDGTGGGSFSDYVNFLYAAAIGIGAFLAVIKIIIAGVKYMMTDVVSTKSNAKGEITGALLGLLLILGAYMVLNIINPRLVNPSVNFQQIPTPPKAVPPPAGVAATGPTTDMAQSTAAANAGNTLAARGGCNVKTTTTLGNNNITSLDMSGCQAGYDPAPVLGAFARDCSAKNGMLSSNKGMTSSCSTPKAGVLISNYGTVTQRASVTNTTLATGDPAQAADLKSTCEDKHGQYSIKNGPTGTFMGAVVTCKLPGIVSYSGSQAQYGQGDCASRTPKGTYEPHTLSADLCIVWN